MKEKEFLFPLSRMDDRHWRSWESKLFLRPPQQSGTTETPPSKDRGGNPSLFLVSI